jgi:hypothetical protein
MSIDFLEFLKIARLSRECFITEKIDGTNATIYISEDLNEFLTGSKSRWITPQNDNAGFSRWAHEHKEELMQLGSGWHRGEWWGPGIQRGYGLRKKCFSLFNVARWSDPNIRPSCCECVPILYQGLFDTNEINKALKLLEEKGSLASPGFMRPEGIVIYHVAANMYFKKTIEKDEEPKSKYQNNNE